MKNKKQLLVTAALLLVLCVLVYFFVFNKSKNTLASEGNTLYTWRDTAAILRLEITDDEGRKAILQRRPAPQTGWTVNQHYTARPDAINTLLTTFYRMSAQYPVANAALPKLQTDFEHPKRTIKIYTHPTDTTPARVWRVAGVPLNNIGVYMQVDGKNNRPFMVNTPNFEGDLLPRFITDVHTWRSRLLFGYKPQDITQIEIDYPNQFQHSFILKVVHFPDSFNLISPTEVPPPQVPYVLNKPMAAQMVQAFSALYAEGFEPHFPNPDSLKQAKPYCQIKLSTQQNQQRSLTVHYMRANQRTKTYNPLSDVNNPTQTPIDRDRFLAFADNGSDVILIQQFAFDKVLKHYQQFFVPLPNN